MFHIGKPKIPSPTGFGGKEKESSNDRRRLLQSAMLQRRSSLTIIEQKFLSDICDNGSDRDVQLVHKNLTSAKVFSFDEAKQQEEAAQEEEEEEEGRMASAGSKRRQSLLKLLRQTPSVLWKAHNTGLAVSKSASRRSLSFTHRQQSHRSLWPRTPARFPRHGCLVQKTSKQQQPTEPRRDSISLPVAIKEGSSSDYSTEPDDSSKGEWLHPADKVPQPLRQLLARKASSNNYRGEGFEVDWKVRFNEDDLSESNEPEEDDRVAAHIHTPRRSLRRPVLMRLASRNLYSGEGLEVADWKSELNETAQTTLQDAFSPRRSHSFDQRFSYERLENHFHQAGIRRCKSDRDLKEVNEIFLQDLQSYDHYDPWLLLDDDTAHSLPFSILGGTQECHPHVVSPPLLESLKEFLPDSIRYDNFWLRYSLVRDGASIHSFLSHTKASQYSLLAIETVDGEVFGCFTGEAWHQSNEGFGNGECFLWKMKHSRRTKSWSVIDQAEMESRVNVYKYTALETPPQMCKKRRIMIGGLGKGTPSTSFTLRDGTVVEPKEWGFGLCIEDDFLNGTTTPCFGFGSPKLTESGTFEIVNMEVWTLTPFSTTKDAEQWELNKLFLQKHIRRI